MASRKKSGVPRSEALAMLRSFVGERDGWLGRVHAGAAAAAIAEEVYAVRERCGLTQAALAALIGSSQSAIARLGDAQYRGHSPGGGVCHSTGGVPRCRSADNHLCAVRVLLPRDHLPQTQSALAPVAAAAPTGAPIPPKCQEEGSRA